MSVAIADVAVLHQHALGELEHEAARVEAGRRERALDVGDDVGLAASWRAETLTLDAQPVGRPAARACQTVDLAAGLREHPAAERHDQPGLLGQRDELAGRDAARAPGAASGQRLDAEQVRRCRRSTIGW